MLDFLGSVGLFLNPRAHGTENSGENTAPAEPEHHKLQHMRTVGDRDGASASEQDVKAFFKAVKQSMAPTAENRR